MDSCDDVDQFSWMRDSMEPTATISLVDQYEDNKASLPLTSDMLRIILIKSFSAPHDWYLYFLSIPISEHQ